MCVVRVADVSRAIRFNFDSFASRNHAGKVKNRQLLVHINLTIKIKIDQCITNFHQP